MDVSTAVTCLGKMFDLSASLSAVDNEFSRHSEYESDGNNLTCIFGARSVLLLIYILRYECVNIYRKYYKMWKLKIKAFDKFDTLFKVVKFLKKFFF